MSEYPRKWQNMKAGEIHDRIEDAEIEIMAAVNREIKKIRKEMDLNVTDIHISVRYHEVGIAPHVRDCKLVVPLQKGLI